MHKALNNQAKSINPNYKSKLLLSPMIILLLFLGYEIHALYLKKSKTYRPIKKKVKDIQIQFLSWSQFGEDRATAREQWQFGFTPSVN